MHPDAYPPNTHKTTTQCVPESKRTLIFAQGLSASIYYYLGESARHGILIDTRHIPPANLLSDVQNIDLVIIVRYLPTVWSQPLQRLRMHTRRVAYFMDDDLMDPQAVAELPKGYRHRVQQQALGMRQIIEALCTEFWVSTAYLAEKYARWKPKVLWPRPALGTRVDHSMIWICYHGTTSHHFEFEWLLPLMREVETSLPRARFEIFGDHAVYKRFRDLPRVNVLHPMSWPNYLDYTSGVRRDIALAPLIPTRFNAGRGPTKFFDFARMGAVGLYTDVDPYRGFIRNGEDGVLLPNDPMSWVKTIVDLAGDAPARERMAAAARERALEMAY